MKKKIISVLITLLMFVLMFLGASYLLRDKSLESKNKLFYDYSDSYDVYIMGGSHSLMAISPLEMYREYGISSYNFANYGQTLPVDYWVLRNACEQHKPEVVLIDLYTLFFDEKYSHVHTGYLHETFDTMPFSITKYQALTDLLDDGENRMEMFLPFSLTHSNWENLNFETIKPNYQFGADVNVMNSRDRYEGDVRITRLVEPFNSQFDPLPTDEIDDSYVISRDYLDMIVNFCEDEGIEVVFVVCPQYMEEDKQMLINSLYDYAEERNIPFLNGMWESFINTRVDMFDAAHLNTSGARKWSSYVASFLSSNYDLTDHRGDENYSFYEDAYQHYLEEEEALLRTSGSIYGCLSMASNPSYDVEIYIPENSATLNDEEVMLLVDNISGVSYVTEDVECDLFMRVIDSDGNMVTDCVFVSDSDGMDGFTRLAR